MIHCTQVAFRKGRVTRQSLIIAPNSGINTFTQVLASAHLIMRLARLFISPCYFVFFLHERDSAISWCGADASGRTVSGIQTDCQGHVVRSRCRNCRISCYSSSRAHDRRRMLPSSPPCKKGGKLEATDFVRFMIYTSDNALAGVCIISVLTARLALSHEREGYAFLGLHETRFPCRHWWCGSREPRDSDEAVRSWRTVTGTSVALGQALVSTPRKLLLANFACHLIAACRSRRGRQTP